MSTNFVSLSYTHADHLAPVIYYRFSINTQFLCANQIRNQYVSVSQVSRRRMMSEIRRRVHCTMSNSSVFCMSASMFAVFFSFHNRLLMRRNSVFLFSVRCERDDCATVHSRHYSSGDLETGKTERRLISSASVSTKCTTHNVTSSQKKRPAADCLFKPALAK